MTDKVVVLVTVSSLKEARKIARGLVEAQLAACVNIAGPVESIYRWQGKIENGRERLLVIKTAREMFAEVEAAIRKLHSSPIPKSSAFPLSTARAIISTGSPSR